MDAGKPNEYHSVEAKRGREFILRLTTGADVYLALQQFAIDHGIRFAKIHAALAQDAALAIEQGIVKVEGKGLCSPLRSPAKHWARFCPCFRHDGEGV